MCALYDLNVNTFIISGGCCFYHIAQSFCDPAFFTDHFSHIAGGNMEMIDDGAGMTEVAS